MCTFFYFNVLIDHLMCNTLASELMINRIRYEIAKNSLINWITKSMNLVYEEEKKTFKEQNYLTEK
jgi:hypothetical protein